MRIPRVYQHFSVGQVISHEDLKMSLKREGHTLRKMVSDLRARGYLIYVRQGLYVLNSLNLRETPWLLDIHPLSILHRLPLNAYLSGLSALSYQASVPFFDCHISSRKKFNHFTFRKYSYVWSQDSEEKEIETHSIQAFGHSFPFRVTSLEKSLIDCLRRPSQSPCDELMAVCDKIEKINVEKVMTLAHEYSNFSLYQRLGFFLEEFKDLWKVPKRVLTILKRYPQKLIPWSSQQSPDEPLDYITNWNILKPKTEEALDNG